jgi:hypothetical protein
MIKIWNNWKKKMKK